MWDELNQGMGCTHFDEVPFKAHSSQVSSVYPETNWRFKTLKLNAFKFSLPLSQLWVDLHHKIIIFHSWNALSTALSLCGVKHFFIQIKRAFNQQQKRKLRNKNVMVWNKASEDVSFISLKIVPSHPLNFPTMFWLTNPQSLLEIKLNHT